MSNPPSDKLNNSIINLTPSISLPNLENDNESDELINDLDSVILVSKVSCSGYLSLSPPGYWYESVALDIWKVACRHVSKFARTVFLHRPFVSVVLE